MKVLLTTLFAALALAVPGVAQADYSTAVLSTHPEAYWPLNEPGGTAIADASGHRHDGTYTAGVFNSGVVSTLSAPGAPLTNSTGLFIHGNVSVYTGQDPGGKVEVAANAWNRWSDRSPFSVNVWLKWDGYWKTCATETVCSDLTQGIVGNQRWAEVTGGWDLQLNGKTADRGDGLLRFNRGTTTLAGPALPKGAWTMVTATYDGSTSRLYYDGALVASQADASSLGGGYANTLYIGAQDYNRYFSGYWGSFNGTIDEVAYWNRALTPDDINALSSGSPESTKPIVYFVPGVAGSGLLTNPPNGMPPPWPDAVPLRFLIPYLGVEPDGVTSIHDLAPDNVLANALGKAFYAPFLEHLRAMESAGSISSFAPWPYDWRLGVNKIAAQFAGTLEERCRTSGGRQIWLLAHSTGGLIVKEALRMMRERGGIYTPETCLNGGGVVFLATPHDGAPKAIGTIINPDLFFGDWASKLLDDAQGMAHVANNWLTAWQLMPARFTSHDPLAGEEIWFDDHADGLGDLNVNGDPLNWALGAKASAEAPYAYDLPHTVGNLPVYNVFGPALPTPGSYGPGICALNREGVRQYVELDSNAHLRSWVYGDTTVPAWSAVWPDSGLPTWSQYSLAGTPHGEIPNAGAVADLLLRVFNGNAYPDVAGLVHGAAAVAEASVPNGGAYRVDTCSPVATTAMYHGNEVGAKTDGTVVDTSGTMLYQPAVERDGSHAQTIVIPVDGAGYPEYRFAATSDGPVSVWETDPDGSQHDFKFDIRLGDTATLSRGATDWVLAIDRGGNGTVDEMLNGNSLDLELSGGGGFGAGGLGDFGEGGSMELAATALSADGDLNLDYAWEIVNDDGDTTTDDEGKLEAEGAHATFTAADGPRRIRIRITVTNHRGQSASAIKTIDVPNAPPAADAGPDAATPWGVPVALHGSVTDSSAADRAAGLHPHWQFGDGSEADGADVTHTYADPGVYTATLTATDKDGATASDTAVVTVTARASRIDWTGDSTSVYGFGRLAAALVDTVDPPTARLGATTLGYAVDGAAESRDLPLGPGAHTVTVSLAANPLYLANDLTTTLVVRNGSGKLTLGTTTAGGAKLAGEVRSDAASVKGELNWRGPDGSSLHLSRFDAYGQQGTAAWAAGTADDGTRVVVHVDAAAPLVEIWRAGVRLGGSGPVAHGSVTLH